MSREQIQHLRTEIGMLFQGSALFDSETVLGNVEFPLMMYTNMSLPNAGNEHGSVWNE